MASKRFRDAVGIDPDRVISAAVDAALGDSQPRDTKKKHHPGRVLAAGAAVAAAAAVGQRRMPRLVKLPLKMGLHKLGNMTHLDDLTGAVRDRADAVRDRLVGDDVEPEDEYYDDEDFDDEEEFDDEPQDEVEDLPEDEDEDFDDEDDEDFDDDEPEDGGPRGEGDEEEPEPVEDEEEEPEALEDDEELEPEDDEELEPEDDDEEIAARSLDLGLTAESSDRRVRGRAPDLFEALRTPHRRAPVMRRGSLRLDPATRPPEPDEGRTSDRPKSRSKKSKSKAARA